MTESFSNIYIASCTQNGGIYQYHLHADGSLTFVEKTLLPFPMYMTSSHDKMYIILRNPFEGSIESGVITYTIAPDGRLTNPSDIVSTKGEEACHILADSSSVNQNPAIYCANYMSGSIIKLSERLITHSGHGAHPERQDGPHTHFVGLTPDQKYIAATDLGTDRIYFYDKDLHEVSTVKLPDGSGPRHLAFHGDILYCVNELNSTISVLKYQDGSASLIHTYHLLSADFEGENTAAAIRVHNGYVYVSNRGHDTIVQFRIDGTALCLEGYYSSQGSSPRDFIVTDDFIITANERPGNAAVIRKEDGECLYTLGIEAALCVFERNSTAI